jgi:hypothetical protein
MTEPSSFCTMCTHTCYFEFIGLAYSLSIHHPGAKFYCMLDTKTKEELDNLTLKPNLDIKVVLGLDKYTGLNRQKMEQMNIIKEFWNNKADIMTYALQYEKDTIFLDSDVFIVNPINCIDNTKELGLSPHYIRKSNTDEVGYYNGGCLWTKNKNVPLCWKKHTVNSRYVDQASLEDVAIDYKHSMFEFGEELNYMPWRILLANNQEEAIKKININNNQVNIGNKPLAFLHTHFHDQRFIQVNNIFINALRKLKRYKELLIIDRIINKNWTIKIPKQPQQGIWNHKNDSFRELALLYKKNNSTIAIELIDSGHCMLGNHILLYDRPTQEWFNQDLANSSLILLGNGDINKEGQILKQNNLNVKPWIFWPRRPLIMEKFLENNKIKHYNERTIESLFIGNIENNVQNQYRNSDYNWENVLHVYHCTQGTQHKFSQEEYLEQLANAKYGLCLRGYGSKCHREVELMALGTVPIITETVCIDSYMDPPQENIHYIRCNNPENLKTILSNISQEKWEAMSNNCYNWYQKNVHSKNSFKNLLSNILYD